MLSPAERDTLRTLARAAIRRGLAGEGPPAIDPAALAPALRAPGAAFVTLLLDGELRGCIGTLEAQRPLAADVAHNAWAAAFRDPRFAPLEAAEAARVELHLSVLSPPQPLTVRDEADLLAQLRPGIDGLVLSEGARRATFLPSVWAQLPAPRDFLAGLLRKGGWRPGHWSPDLRVARYTVEEF